MINLYNDDFLQVDLSEIYPINLVITSPPYNCGIDYGKYKDNMTYGGYLRWCKKWLEKIYNYLADDGRICINVPFTISPEHLNESNGIDDINFSVLSDYTQICANAGFKYWRTIIWKKSISNGSTTWGSWRNASSPFMRDPSEAILVCYKKQWKRLMKGESTITGPDFMSYTKNIWTFHPKPQSDHPSAFPLELPNRCIKLLSYKNDWVFDPFMGSGTVGESAVRLDRNFVGVELSPDYFTKSKERIEQAEYQTNLRRGYFANGDDSEDDDKKLIDNLPLT